jgi:acyl-coenzyme A synthetase/AMP-(fatty) acid ligase
VWYSVPSILALMAQYGKMERHDYSALRAVLFAGEVFPLPHLRRLRQYWPAPRYFNLYGPTETNVCTWYQLPAEIPAERSEPFPIGAPCSNARARVVDAEGNDVPSGGEGELCIAGDGVMQGYWHLPEATERAFLGGECWYRTGDLVVDDGSGNYLYRGRRDRMVKRRGYRIELGEIESGLYRHPGVREAAALATRGAEGEVVIVAHLALGEGEAASVIAFKRFALTVLPAYMVPDRYVFQPELPKTSTGKVDYQLLGAGELIR